MNGIEMMIVNILNGIGLDPQELMTKANNLISNVENKLEKFDERLGRIEKALNIVSDQDQKQIATAETIAHDEAVAEALAENVK